MDAVENQILSREHESKLEQLVSSVSINECDIDTKRETQKANGYLETWVGHFGTCQDRKQGRRELCFTEGLGDVSDQVGYCLEALAVISETMVTEAWRGGIADGFCIITSLVCEAANKTIQTLDQERKHAARENRKLREDLERAQGQETDVTNTQNHSESL